MEVELYLELRKAEEQREEIKRMIIDIRSLLEELSTEEEEEPTEETNEQEEEEQTTTRPRIETNVKKN